MMKDDEMSCSYHILHSRVFPQDLIVHSRDVFVLENTVFDSIFLSLTTSLEKSPLTKLRTFLVSTCVISLFLNSLIVKIAAILHHLSQCASDV